VYAGDERALGAEAVFPSLVEAERRGGSIVRGLLAARRERAGLPAALPGIHSCADGLGALPARMAAELGESLALGAPVAFLAPEAGGWRVEAARGEGALWSERVVLAAPAPAAAELLRPVDARAAELLAGIDHAPLVVSHVGIATTGVRHHLEGFGFLVPRAAGLGLLGCLFLSNLFAGRAPAGRALLTCMQGGTRWRDAVEAPEDLLRAHLLSDLDRTLGLRSEPELLRTLRWPRAVPQPGPDHPRRVAELRERLAALGGPGGARIEPAGAWLAGVSLADTLASGVAAARRLLGA
jgi:oxygen-dependent protoporphyrinogen oxidase